MIKQLIKLANHLDKKGLVKEADYLDKIIKNASIEEMQEFLEDAGKSLESVWTTFSCFGRDEGPMPSTHVESKFDLNTTIGTVKCVCKRDALNNDALDNDEKEEDYNNCVQNWINKAILELSHTKDTI